MNKISQNEQMAFIIRHTRTQNIGTPRISEHRQLKSHGNSLKCHGKVMEKSWNYLTLPCYLVVSSGITVPRQRCNRNLFCWANLRHQLSDFCGNPEYMQSFIISHSSCAEQYGDMSSDTQIHSHTIKPLTAGVRQVGHTSLKF